MVSTVSSLTPDNGIVMQHIEFCYVELHRSGFISFRTLEKTAGILPLNLTIAHYGHCLEVTLSYV